MDLQLPMQSVAITTNLSSNHAHDKVRWIQQYVIKYVSDLWQVGGRNLHEINKSSKAFNCLY
jgi:hypothetical protein